MRRDLRPRLRIAVLLALLLTVVASPTVARAAEQGVVPDITWGTSTSDIDRTVGVMQQAGVKWARTNISWASLEPNAKGTFSSGYVSQIDYAIDKARAAGIQLIMPLADGVPYWASADPAKYVDSSGVKHWNKYYRPTNFSDYADALRYTVTHYAAKGVHVYEVWNEPNLSYFWPSGVNASEYAQMLRAAYPAAKAADPSATVLLGGLSRNDHNYLDQVYAAGAQPYFDGVGDHSYPTGDPANCWTDSSGKLDREAMCGIEEIRNSMVAHGDSGKSVWLTEFGWSTCSNSYSGCYGKGVTESQQADYLARGYERINSSYPWVKVALWYNLRNTYFRTEDPGDWNANLGLVHIGFTPKPALAAFESIGSATTSTSPSPDPSPSPGPTQSPSNAAPTVTLTQPLAGDVFDRSLVLAANAGDDHGVTKVEFRVDGKLVNTDKSAPYGLTWGAKKLSYGAHTVTATAYDAAGLSSTDSLDVTRAQATATVLRISGTTAYAAGAGTRGAGSVLVATGRVRGATRGRVAVRVERRLGGGRYRGARTLMARIDRRGRFRAVVRVRRAGRYRVRAAFRGGPRVAPSRSAYAYFRRGA